jgi:hypothetical protein
MDHQDFDCLVRSATTIGTRRGLLRLLAALSLPRMFATLCEEERSAAKRKRPERQKVHQSGNVQSKGKRKRKKKKNRCQPDSNARTCARRCGQTTNNCGKQVDCGPCLCSPSCAVCQTCDAASGQCVPNAAFAGQDCGQPGEVCQANGACACDVCASGCPFATLQDAIDAAAPGTTLSLCQGTFGPAVIGKDLILTGVGDGASPASNTNLSVPDANSDRVVAINSGCVVTLRRLRIASNLFPVGGIGNSGTLNMIDCTLTRNHELTNGGGILNINGATLTMTGCTVSQNQAGSGGGVVNFGTATLTDCVIAGNRADFNIGGGIVQGGGALTIDGCLVTGNNAFQGGGLFVVASPDVTINDSSIRGNTASAMDGGGGIFNDSSTITLVSSPVEDNFANGVPNNCGGNPVPGCVG